MLPASLPRAAKLADSRTRPAWPFEGYVAERHASMPEYMVVWVPCGCYWIGNVDGEFTTPCNTDACVFQYAEVHRALEAFKRIEEASKAPKESKLESVPVPDVVGVHTAELAGRGQEEPPEATDMISEGGPVDAAMPEVPPPAGHL
jgi:hypothetical protein